MPVLKFLWDTGIRSAMRFFSQSILLANEQFILLMKQQYWHIRFASVRPFFNHANTKRYVFFGNQQVAFLNFIHQIWIRKKMVLARTIA